MHTQHIWQLAHSKVVFLQRITREYSTRVLAAALLPNNKSLRWQPAAICLQSAVMLCRYCTAQPYLFDLKSRSSL